MAGGKQETSWVNALLMLAFARAIVMGFVRECTLLVDPHERAIQRAIDE
jgi:hypothetical protein